MPLQHAPGACYQVLYAVSSKRGDFVGGGVDMGDAGAGLIGAQDVSSRFSRQSGEVVAARSV